MRSMSVSPRRISQKPHDRISPNFVHVACDVFSDGVWFVMYTSVFLDDEIGKMCIWILLLQIMEKEL